MLHAYILTRLPYFFNTVGDSFSNSESVHIANLLIDRFHQPPSQVIVAFQSPATSVNDPRYPQELLIIIGRLHSFPHVASITPGGVGQDGRTTFLVVGFNKDYDFMETYVADFRTLLPRGSAAGPAHAYLTAQLAVNDELNTITLGDAERADATVLPIALLILLIVFGTFTAAILPPLLALVSIPVALAIIYPIALHAPISIFVLSVASLIGLGISIDYSLFITRRFREELAHGREVSEAVAWTVATAGEAILFSGLTVVIGFTGLVLFGIGLLTSEALGGASVVVIAVAAALTLLPALLSVMGKRINALRVPWLWRLTMPAPTATNGAAEESGFWHRLAMGVMRRPVMVIVLVIAILFGLAWPVFSLDIGTSGSGILPPSSEAPQGLGILQAQYPAFNASPVDIIAQTTDGSGMLTPENLSRVAYLTQWLASQPHVTGVVSLNSPPAAPGGAGIKQEP